jgi:hypothetical protein
MEYAAAVTGEGLAVRLVVGLPLAAQLGVEACVTVTVVVAMSLLSACELVEAQFLLL